MYAAKYFQVIDEDEIFSFIQKHAFGQLISSHESKIIATHIPFLIEPEKRLLVAHLSKANPQWQSIENQEALVTFQGPHGYISPSWYSSQGVPTWNYQAVHVYANVSVFHDAEQLKTVVDQLTYKYEEKLESPWNPDYSANKLRGIVGLSLSISKIECTYKLNQNKTKPEQRNVAEKLKTYGNIDLAEAMLNANQL